MAFAPVSGTAPAGGSQTALRQANSRRVLDALRTGGAASQATLARATGLSRQTVNNVVRSLADVGDVEISTGATGRETLVSLQPSTGVIIGLSIEYGEARAVLISLPEGTRTDAVPVSLSGSLHPVEHDVEAIVRLMDSLMSDSGVAASAILGVGVTLPQPVDLRTRSIAPTPVFPGWAGVPIIELLSERLAVDIVVENDANAAALAELKWGVGREYPDFVYVMAAFGLGAGIVSDGHLFRGGNGMAGEIGHITIDDRGPVCICGKRGDLGALASGRALVNQLRDLGDTETTLEKLIVQARSGEVRATRMIAAAGRYIGMALAHVVGIVAPSRIVLGGPLSEAGAVLLDPIAAALRDTVITPLTGSTELAATQLGSDAALLGAVALVIDGKGISIEVVPAWVHAMSAPSPAQESTPRHGPG